jgi:hypothetical protein
MKQATRIVMDEAEIDGWSDETDEETSGDKNKEKVRRINKMSLDELNDILVSIIPSMSFTTRNGYVARVC